MEFKREANRIYAENDAGELVAEVTFPALDGETVNINHTFVDGSLRGQGAAARLLEAAADELTASGRKAVPTCSYAIKWFEEHPERSGLLKR